MSEIARRETDAAVPLHVVEGIVVSDLAVAEPFSNPEEAQAAIAEAFDFLRTGGDLIERGHELLVLAQARDAHRLLGFTDWNDCLLSNIEAHLRQSIAPAYRRELTTRLRRQYGVSTRAISQRLGVSHMTTQRDLQRARDAGELPDEGDTVVGTDGTSQPAKRARAPYPRTVDTKMLALFKAINAVHAAVTKDERFKENGSRTSTKWLGELEGLQLDKLEQVLEHLRAAKEGSPR